MSETHAVGILLPMHTEAFGARDADGVPIVVLPGLGVHDYLRLACDRLARRSGRHVMLVEPPGFGANAAALPTTPTVASVTARLRDWLTSQGTVCLLGQSTGCLLASRLARADQHLDVRDVVLVSPVFDPAISTPVPIGGGFLRNAPREPWWLGPLEVPEWIRNARALPGYFRSCLAESVDEHVDAARCPVLVVRGERDPMSRHEWTARLADAPGRRLVIVPGGSHTFMAARPEALADALVTGGVGAEIR
jgi:pimeloyl-ACP methyl ester carboxylesterase